jgi:hypothetical protein
LVAPLGCKKDDDEKSKDEVGAAVFLAPADIAKGDVKVLSKEEAASKLEDLSDLYDHEPESTSSTLRLVDDENDDATGKCIDDKFMAITVSGTKSSLSLDATPDLSSCFTAQSGGGVTKATMHVAIAVGCDGTSFEAYDGKTLKELESADDQIVHLCDAGSSRTQMFNFALDEEGSQTLGTATIDMKIHLVTATMTGAAEGCTETLTGTSWKLDDGCMVVNKSSTTITGGESEDSGKEDYTSLTSVGLTRGGGKTDEFYASGQYAVVVNDWNGSVTYTSVTAAPTYTLTKGGETATGTISGSGSPTTLKLASPAARARALFGVLE